MRLFRWTSLTLAAVVAAALITPAHAQQVEIKPAAKVKRDKYFILPDEIAERPELITAYDVIKVLRNQWLRITRGSGGGMGSGSKPASGAYTPPARCGAGTCPEASGSSGGSPVPRESGSPYAESSTTMQSGGKVGPVLYIDEVKQEQLEELRNIKATDIAEIHYLTGNLALGRYGDGHANGAILLKRTKFTQP